MTEPHRWIAVALLGGGGLFAGTAPIPAQAPDQLVYRGSVSVFDGKARLEEPSGLALDPESGTFWTVSDDTERLFRIDADGRIVARSDKLRHLQDAEAVAVAGPGRVLVLSERRGSVFEVDPDSAERPVEHPLLEMRGAALLRDALGGQPERLSPEGLAIDPATGRVFVANERGPRLLLTLTATLDEILSVTPLTEARGFVSPAADARRLDVSGLVWDARRGGLWLTSDTGECLFFWELGARPARRFDLLWLSDGKVRAVENAEGVALDADGAALLVITDDGKRSRLHRYELETPKAE
ncbi:SdiA-regulated domain-containing protein [Cognatishimia sp. F0-27]|uniref:SdiA-regulated domain-containing protein n=1 Tax=Cognatishimia sp. F0-27 TaxID=2816855 RepID=UPI001D0CBFC7|nr:SdiA-regulated domain-containing protein [Cognatishimia sp. F0-27]MCC1494523.1 SdiA-regulated domain-containing protein [Cognatishimia sp. F0-27]